MKCRLAFAITIATCGWGMSLSWASAQMVASETLIAFGAGTIGSWGTEYSVSNATSSPTLVYVGNTPEIPTACSPLIGCSQFAMLLPVNPNGSAMSPGPALGFGTLHLKAVDNPVPPTVRARIMNSANPSQVAEVPVFRLATLLALSPSQLVFSGATRSGSSHCNLLLAVLRAADDFTPRSASVKVEVYAASGQMVASRDLNLEGGQTLFLIDILGSLGVASLDHGQLRVTRTGGNGVIWGIMPTLSADGNVSIALGANP